MLQLPAECLKTALLGLDYETKWMKCAEDKLVSLYFELFSLQTPPPPKMQHNSAVKLLTKQWQKNTDAFSALIYSL